jgi:hypothetical protein
MNAQEFVLDLADRLLDQGRTVEFSEQSDYIYIVSRSRHLSEATLEASACKLTSTGEWHFRGLRVYRRYCDPIDFNTRNESLKAIHETVV